MSLPGPLKADRTERLAEALGWRPEAESAADESEGRSPRAGGTTASMRRVVRMVARPVVKRIRLAATATGARARDEMEALGETASSILAEARPWQHQRQRVLLRIVEVEMLKAELRAAEAALEQLGRAVAPSVGRDGAPVALSQLRSRVRSCERRIQLLEADAGAPSGTAGRPGPGSGSRLDYEGFERRFRGDPLDVATTLDERYGPLLRDHPPVLQIGCRAGALLALLADRGVPAMGIDTSASMAAEARAGGLDVVPADPVVFLRQQPRGTYGAIIATHVVEHLGRDEVLELLRLSCTRLRPGGILIAETPNPSSLVVLGNSYVLDPTHVRPLHPDLLAFLCQTAGFEVVETHFFAPATGYQLELVTDPAAPSWVADVNRVFERLNTVLFGPQDVAVVATAPTSSEPTIAGIAGSS